MGSVRGSLIALDDVHSYEYLGREHFDPPETFPVGTAVVVCPPTTFGDGPRIYEISIDIKGSLWYHFRRR
jgi:hypothetical protein